MSALVSVEALTDLGDYVAEALPKSVLARSVEKQELSLTIQCQDVLSVLRFLRDDPECYFKLLIDITAVDWPGRGEDRFDVVYQLLSIKNNQRIRIKLATDGHTTVNSIVSIFSAATWFEREVWDMYGIVFDGNPDLRRILTDYGFEGHPLRKDFPLSGYTELRYDEEEARIVYEPVQLQQDYRDFDFISPWEAMTEVQLPGDEKAVKPLTGHEEKAQQG